MRALVLTLALVAVASGGAGCGGGKATHAAHVTRRAARHGPVAVDGATLFEGHCSQCHALLHRARRSDSTVGPDLSRIRLTAAQVREQIVRGGPGMPAMSITKAQVDLVAPYVQAASNRLGRPLAHVTVRVRQARRVYREQCGMCHALADAHTRGGEAVDFNVSPWNAEAVRGAVVTGFAFMPSLTLSNAELDRLARYVAAVGGRRAG